MPKLKTRRSAAKRFKKTGTGKFVYNRKGKSHLLSCKTRKRKRRLRKSAVLSDCMTGAVKRMVPFM
jgi:large subunit ribosomal protein L35